MYAFDRDEPAPRTWPIPTIDTTPDGDLVVLLPGYGPIRAIVTEQPHPREPVAVLCQEFDGKRWTTVEKRSARRPSRALERAVDWLYQRSLWVIGGDQVYPGWPARVVEVRRRRAA